jgi:hypothetical protein
MANLVLPRVQAMVLCDGIKESAQEYGVFHLQGVRSDIQVRSFPYTHSRLGVFLQMSGHKGTASCHVEINHAATDDVVFRTTPHVVEFEEPMVIVPVVFRLRNCSFPTPGVYYVQMFGEAKLIGERPLHVAEEA